MSILINMELPTDRPQLLWIYPNGKAMTVQSDVDPWKELQAVPVPPHGRLIDADALIRDWPTGFVKTADVINNTPTIIPTDQAEEGE